MESIFNFLSSAMNGNFALALLASFGWGVASILLSPCHLSGIPLVIGFVSNQSGRGKKNAVGLSIVFSVGILLTIAVIGAVTAALGRLMGDIGDFGNYLVAGIFFLAGLYLLDAIKIGGGRGMQGTRFTGYPAALVFGLVFGFALGPCAFAFMAPVLATVFDTARTDILSAIAFLGAFAVGHCAVIAGAGSAGGAVGKYLDKAGKNGALTMLKRVCGALVILAGFYFIFK